MKCEIDRRSRLSYEEFAEKYLYANKPVIVTDAIPGWKCLSRWSPEFFKREFGEMKFGIDEDLKGPAAYDSSSNTVEYTMARFIDCVLESTDENPAPYFRNRVLYDMFPSLKSDIEPIPEYLLPNWLPDRYLVSYVSKVLNRGAALELYIGGKGGTFPVCIMTGRERMRSSCRYTDASSSSFIHRNRNHFSTRLRRRRTSHCSTALKVSILRNFRCLRKRSRQHSSLNPVRWFSFPAIGGTPPGC